MYLYMYLCVCTTFVAIIKCYCNVYFNPMLLETLKVSAFYRKSILAVSSELN